MSLRLFRRFLGCNKICCKSRHFTLCSVNQTPTNRLRHVRWITVINNPATRTTAKSYVRTIASSRHQGGPPTPVSEFIFTRNISRSSCSMARDLGRGYDETPIHDGDLDVEFLSEEYIEDDDLRSHYDSHHVTPVDGHRVFVVQPNVKWGPKKQKFTTGELQLQEAIALVRTLKNWTVVEAVAISLKKPDGRFVFGKGNFASLTEQIKSRPDVTAVFMSVEMLTGLRHKMLEDTWGVKVFDRYTIVLNIFKEHAVTKEAKLQIALAEIPYLRSRLKGMVADMDQQSGAQQYIGGSGETLMERQKRLLYERETKIKKRLSRLKKRRELLRSARKKRKFPTVSVVGYTNSGKTTLIKALTGDTDLQPEDKLFATLDVTSHAGTLPSHMTVIYVDTVGFISVLPHSLIDAFSATLEDVILSDLIIHICDVSHPDFMAQKHNVHRVLSDLGLPENLKENMLEVGNKIDLLERPVSDVQDSCSTMVSALNGTGLQQLQEEIQARLLKVTDTVLKTVKIPMNGPHLSWLYKEAAVQSSEVTEDEEHLLVDVLMSGAAYGKFKSRFGDLSV
ncbi:putative GTP-binding protein 6 [Ptychodera flava]|uniref:putative GTP-binding protein 6 n=1 Tax=Ptychodera flava TaxID=63121 RepID=UPI00396AADF1